MQHVQALHAGAGQGCLMAMEWEGRTNTPSQVFSVKSAVELVASPKACSEMVMGGAPNTSTSVATSPVTWPRL